MVRKVLLAFLLRIAAASLAFASDPSPLQDLCVADLNSTVNGFVCKYPKLAMANDFFFGRLDKVRTPTNLVGSNVAAVNVNQIPGFNTLGISMVRIDYASYGQNPPHTHPRATEILQTWRAPCSWVLVTSNTENRLINKVLQKGDMFSFPIRLIHFQFKVGNTNVVDVIAALSSQNPGDTIADSIFWLKLKISSDILARLSKWRKPSLIGFSPTFRPSF